MSDNKLSLSIHLFGVSFTPKLVPTIGLVCVLPILISLGFWQLHRADYKKALTSLYEKRRSAAPVALNKIPSDLSSLRFYKVSVSGRYDNQHQLLLDNRYHNHHPGYEVITPIQLSSGEILLINRGWIPLGQSRQILPTIKNINGKQRIVGQLKPLPKKIFHLGNELQTGWPRVIESLSEQTLNTVFKDKKISPIVLLMDKNQQHGFVREFKITTFPASKHLGYAVQWFGLALTLLIIYFVLNIKRD